MGLSCLFSSKGYIPSLTKRSLKKSSKELSSVKPLPDWPWYLLSKQRASFHPQFSVKASLPVDSTAEHGIHMKMKEEFVCVAGLVTILHTACLSKENLGTVTSDVPQSAMTS